MGEGTRYLLLLTLTGYRASFCTCVRVYVPEERHGCNRTDDHLVLTAHKKKFIGFYLPICIFPVCAGNTGNKPCGNYLNSFMVIVTAREKS